MKFISNIVIVAISTFALSTTASLASPEGQSPDIEAASAASLAGPAISVPAFRLPPSVYLSDEARKALANEKPEEGDALGGLIASGKVKQIRTSYAAMLTKRWPAQLQQFRASARAEILGGVRVIRVASTQKRKLRGVVIYLPGGGFVMGMPEMDVPLAARLASMTGLEFVLVDYRQAPEVVFPAASEDVAAVYKALLKNHRAKHIAIGGSSAGGLLTAQSIAWFEKNDMPAPGAAAILCASADARWGGDAWFWQKPIQGLKSPPTLDERFYYGDHNLADPLMSPIESSSVLEKFPPTLLLTATRAGEMSAAVDTHRRLIKAGVTADLHAWDGLGHCFFSNPDLPESSEAYDVIANFFTKQLGR